jgi:predicted dehydrogenase
MSEIRYGVIGTGMMGVEHVQNILATGRGVVTALADPVVSSLDQALAACGDSSAPLTFTDHRALLEAGVCDAVVVATPNMTHRSVLADVLAAPVHVLVEKPLCITTAECLEVKALAVDRRHLVWVGLEYRYMPPVTALLNEIRSGAVGTVHMVAIREHRFPFLQKVNDWNRFSANTGGTLVEKTCHFFDLMNLVLDGARPVRVFASGGQSVNHLDEVYDGKRADMLDNAFVIVEYDTGARGLLDLCMFAEATHNQEELSVVGDLGKVEALIPDDELRVGRRGEHWIGGVERRHVVDDSIAHQGLHHGSSFIEHQHFIDAVLEGRDAEVTIDDGLLSVAIGEAAHRSIETGGPVDMADLLG